MIYYKNFVKNKKPARENIKFSIFDSGVENVDDSIAKPNSCKSFYNLSFVDGALKTGLGFSELAVPASETDLQTTHTFDFSQKIDDIKGIWLDRWYNESEEKYNYQIILMDSSFYLWGVPLPDEYSGRIWTKSDKLTSAPTFQCQFRLDNKDCCLFFSDGGMLVIGQGKEGIKDNVPALISCVVHYDNFFGITNKNRNTLIYTKNLDVQNWTDDQNSTIEFLDNRGAFTRLVAFNDYVYLFRENGITKISLYSTKNQFSFTHLYTSSSKIFENSICVCGDRVLFITRDGLYSFNGNSVSKICEDYDIYFRNLDNTNCTSACLDGKYYFASRCNFADGTKVGCESKTYQNNVLFEIDINNFNVNLYRGVDIKKLLAIDTPFLSKLCACFYNDNKQKLGQLDYSGKTFASRNRKMWMSHKTDLGYSASKRIKEVRLTTLYACKLKISSDIQEKTINFVGKTTFQRKKVNIKGNLFQFTFETDEIKCDIKKPVIVFDVDEIL